MNKIIIFGPPGSGKSFFSKKLKDVLNIEVIHLDNLFCLENGKLLPNSKINEILNNLLNKEEAIIEGYYPHQLEERLSWCNKCFYFDLNKEEIYEGLLKRMDEESDDCPFIRKKEELALFEEHYHHYITYIKPMVMSLFNKYPNVEITTFHTREEVNRYLVKFI